jgi:hypothetical protein
MTAVLPSLRLRRRNPTGTAQTQQRGHYGPEIKRLEDVVHGLVVENRALLAELDAARAENDRLRREVQVWETIVHARAEHRVTADWAATRTHVLPAVASRPTVVSPVHGTIDMLPTIRSDR